MITALQQLTAVSGELNQADAVLRRLVQRFESEGAKRDALSVLAALDRITAAKRVLGVAEAPNA